MLNRVIGVVVILVAILVGVLMIFPRYRVPSGAMVPTIPIGSQIFMVRTKEVKRGDIVVYRYPPDPDVTFAKRLIGLPGETIEIRNKCVFINGRELAEPYKMHNDPQIFPDTPNLPEPYRSRDHYKPFVIPANHYFVLGDNRDQSNDSRYYGTVPRENIRGKVVLGVNLKRGFWRVR